MLFILNIIKNNHAQGENTKESIFAQRGAGEHRRGHHGHES